MSDKNKTDLPPRTAELYDNGNGLFDSFDRDWVHLAAELERELADMKAQRDDVRQIYCLEKSPQPEWFAQEMGWDCFAQEEANHNNKLFREGKL